CSFLHRQRPTEVERRVCTVVARAAATNCLRRPIGPPPPLFVCSFGYLAFAAAALLRSRNVHFTHHFPVMPFCPATHTSERGNKRPPQPGQGVFDGNGLRLRHTPFRLGIVPVRPRGAIRNTDVP